MTERRTQPGGFTIMELVVALAGLAVGLTLVLELGVWSTLERKRTLLRAEALETAANILEAAQAAGSAALTKEWAAEQQLPPALAPQLKEGRLNVRVDPERPPSRMVRLTVAIAWQGNGIDSGQPVVLTGWFGPRSSERKDKR